MPFPKADKIWMDGELVDWDDATVHVLTPTLHYGYGVFEGIRAYPTDEGPAVFQLRPHLERLLRSARIYPPLDSVPYTVDDLVDATTDLIRTNGHDEGCYIRPTIILSYGEIGLNPLPSTPQTIIATWEWGAYLGEDSLINGVRVMISSYRRIGKNTWRGMRLDPAWPEYKSYTTKDAVIDIKSFYSTSTDPSQAKRFAKKKSADGREGFLLECVLRNGRDISFLSEHGKEQEVLVLPGAKLKVIGEVAAGRFPDGVDLARVPGRGALGPRRGHTEGLQRPPGLVGGRVEAELGVREAAARRDRRQVEAVQGARVGAGLRVDLEPRVGAVVLARRALQDPASGPRRGVDPGLGRQ
jgi:hypothetical protein